MRRMRFSAVACFFQVNQNKKIRILTRQIEIRSGRYILTKDMELPVSRLDGFIVYLIFVELRIIFVEIGMYVCTGEKNIVNQQARKHAIFAPCMRRSPGLAKRGVHLRARSSPPLRL